MNNIAISISGQPYSYPECFDSFLNVYDFDDSKVFAHFWWDESYIDKCFKMHYNLKLKNTINILIEQFKITNLCLEKYKKYDVTFVKNINLDVWRNMSINFYKMMTPIFLYGYMSQIDSLNTSLKNIDEKKFDVLIRTRPDIVYTKNIKNTIKTLNFKEDVIFFQSSMDGGHLYAGEFPNNPCDWFYMGHPKTIKKFSLLLNNELKNKFKNGIIHMRDYTKLLCEENNIKIELFDFGALIYKQTNLFDKKYKNDILTYLNDYDEETSSVKNMDIWPCWIDNVDFKYFKNFLI
jgi:hypothetical protein